MVDAVTAAVAVDSVTEVVYCTVLLTSVTVIVGSVSFSVFSGSANTVIESIAEEIIPDNIKYLIFIVLLLPPCYHLISS